MTKASATEARAASLDVERWFGEHYAAIRRYLTRRLGAEASEDAAAEVFVRALKSHRRFAALRSQNEGAVPIAWLYGIATNVVGDSRRIERRRLATIERLAAERVAEPTRFDRHQAELDPALVAALRRLSFDQRDALLLVVWGELSYEETALALDVPVGTIRSRIGRSRERLKPFLLDHTHERQTQPRSEICDAR